MADSDTTIDQISSSMAQKEVVVNANFDACSPAFGYGRRASTTEALTWGYHEAIIDVAGVPTEIAAGTIALTASATNYLYRTSAGVVTKVTSAPTGWPGPITSPAGAIALYTIVTGTATVTSYDDHRLSSGGVGSAGPTGATGATGATGPAGPTNLPVNSQSTNYTTVLGDAGGLILHPSSDANARTFTIAANASVAYTNGTTLTFVNETSQVLSIAITSDTLKLAGAGTTGTRSLAQHGVATAVKIASTTWYISGSTGLT